MKESTEKEIPQPEKTEVTKEELASLMKACKEVRDHRHALTQGDEIPAGYDYLRGYYLAWAYTVDTLKKWEAMDISAEKLCEELHALCDDRHQNYLFYDKRVQEQEHILKHQHNAGMCDGYFSIVTILCDSLQIPYPVVNDEGEQGQSPFTQNGEEHGSR